MKIIALFLAFVVAFVCGMCFEKGRAISDQYQVEYQMDKVVGNQE